MPRMSARATAVFLACIALLWVVLPRLRPATNEASEVRQAETKLDQASAQRRIRVLQNMIGSDFSTVDSAGNQVTRAQFLNRLRSSPWKVEALHLKGLEIRFYSDVAVVTGSDQVQARDKKGDQRSTAYRFLHVFQKRNGHWFLIAALGSSPGLP